MLIADTILPTLSIIIPTYNSERVLDDCLLSVVGQTYPNMEVIIMDGGSKDGTIDIAKRYAKQYSHVRWYSEKDKGIYDAMNKGIGLSSGEWLYFLGSDDVLNDRCIIEKIFTNANNRQYEIIYGNVLFKTQKLVYLGEFDSDKLIQHNISHQALFTHRTVFEKLGLFDIRYKACADYALNLAWFTNKEFGYIYVPEIIAIFNDDGFSSNFWDTPFYNDLPGIVRKNFGFRYYYRFFILPKLRLQYQVVLVKKMLLRLLPPTFLIRSKKTVKKILRWEN